MCRQMSKNKENKLIPKLRFPQFVNEIGWEVKKLGEVATFVNEKTPLKNLSINSYISTENILSDFAGVTSASGLPTSGNFTKYRKGDVLISNIRPYLKKVWFSDKEGAGSNDVFVVRTKSDLQDLFLSFLLKNDNFINYVMVGAKGVKMPRGDKDLISKYPISFPSKTEQQKIASCLSSLDEVITAESQKLEVLKEHKKGLLQNLFPPPSTSSGGERVPKLRFKEFKGEWAEKTLGELVDIASGFSPSQYNLSRSGRFAFLKVEDLNNCGKYQIRSREYSNDELNVVSANSIIFPKRGAAIELNKIRINNDEVLMDTNLMALTPNDNVETEFLFYLLLNVGLNKIADSSTIPQINNKHIIPFQILIPSKPEQQKIASCLSSLDEIIQAQAEKIELLHLHKKGLLQGLFPTMNEILRG